MNEFDGCIVVTFEEAKEQLEEIERQLAIKLSITDPNIRDALIQLDRDGKLIEDELVADWHDLYSRYQNFLRHL